MIFVCRSGTSHGSFQNRSTARFRAVDFVNRCRKRADAASTAWAAALLDNGATTLPSGGLVKLFVARALALTVLVGLYIVTPIAGVAALAAGFGFLAGQRTPDFKPMRRGLSS
jgi:hypothetical protein